VCRLPLRSLRYPQPASSLCTWHESLAAYDWHRHRRLMNRVDRVSHPVYRQSRSVQLPSCVRRSPTREWRAPIGRCIASSVAVCDKQGTLECKLGRLRIRALHATSAFHCKSDCSDATRHSSRTPCTKGGVADYSMGRGRLAAPHMPDSVAP
jgi:hypothetical protein